MTPEQEKRLDEIQQHHEDGTATDVDVDGFITLAHELDDALLTMEGCWQLVMKDRDSLRVQVEGLKQEADTAFGNFALADATVQAHHRTIQKLLGLRKFARHLASCRLEGDPHMFNGCDCGLDATLRETEGLVKP